LRPSGEWRPEARGWTVVRVAEGAGYCLQGAGARELNPGDTLVSAPAASITIRASQLGVLKLDFYLVLPQYLNGLLTVTEWRQLEDAAKESAPRVLHFPANEPAAQKFTRIAGQRQRDCLSSRSAMLQLWASAINSLLPANDMSGGGLQLRDRFREFIGKMSESELATRSLSELAGQLHCSERHFSRLFREEFNISLRSRQTELRLQRARQLLAATNTKIINVAYESGYRHLGLFNQMFKRRFGLTPSAWRQKNISSPAGNFPTRSGGVAMAMLLLLMQIFFSTGVKAETTNGSPSTNAAPGFKVEKYLVSGNTILTAEKLGTLFTNVPESFGTNVTFAEIRSALGQLQTAYRERGYVTVSVGLPPQKLTNATVKIKVTEGRLADIKVQGNNWFSTPNVLRSLPSLHTNMLLNSHVFQRELDLANANRDRQIYPVIGPGLEPGTSALTLKVKDRFPLHSRVEFNNSGTPGTPDDRISFNASYGNLWQLEHQVGLQYGFSPLGYSSAQDFNLSPFDAPSVANYSAYYRLPLGRPTSVQHQVDTSNGRFGYNEVTHQFQMPPPSGRPELTLFASRSRNDTGVVPGPASTVVSTPLLTIVSQDTGQNITLNEGIGAKLTVPLPQLGRLSSIFSFGVDYKHFQQNSYNSNNFYATTSITNSDGSVQKISSTVSSGQPVLRSQVNYFPINVGLSGSAPDRWGQTFFNAQANFNFATLDGETKFGTNNPVPNGLAGVAGSTAVHDNYITLQLGADRLQRIYRDWTVKIHADGQWADGRLFSNEQFGMGGLAGVRGYAEGQAYGDAGWRFSLEPQTPLINIGMVDGDVPFWMRASVFMDYGQIYALDGGVFGSVPGSPAHLDFLGTGWSLTANIGSHLDARLAMAFPLLNPAGISGWSPLHDLHIYFAVGGQF